MKQWLVVLLLLYPAVVEAHSAPLPHHPIARGVVFIVLMTALGLFIFLSVKSSSK